MSRLGDRLLKQVQEINFPRSSVRVYFGSVDKRNASSILDNFRSEYIPGQSWAVVSKDQFGFELAFFDMDGTLISSESSVELAARFLTKELRDEVEAITAKSMAGEISFADNIAKKTKYFQGTTKQQLDLVTSECRFHEGAEDFVDYLHSRGVRSFLVTGGLKTMAAPYAKRLHMSGFCANTEEWQYHQSQGGKWVMTGELKPPIITSMAKADYLKAQCHKYQIAIEKTLMIGDGANDQDMAMAAGLAVGFKPKSCLIPYLHVVNETGHHGFMSDLIDHINDEA
ncbi:MAG: HAD-IB family phosphatase [Proteobacteria bacterium]|nr:HAD-IB family phosphatase [Pseudomonadota bacterium]